MQLGLRELDNYELSNQAFYLAFLKNPDKIRPNSDCEITQEMYDLYKN